MRFCGALEPSWHRTHLPVIESSREEECFPILTDMHGGVNLLDFSGEAILIDGASMTFHLKLLNHPILTTWKNIAVSPHLETFEKQHHTTRAAKLNESLA